MEERLELDVEVRLVTLDTSENNKDGAGDREGEVEAEAEAYRRALSYSSSSSSSATAPSCAWRNGSRRFLDRFFVFVFDAFFHPPFTTARAPVGLTASHSRGWGPPSPFAVPFVRSDADSSAMLLRPCATFCQMRATPSRDALRGLLGSREPERERMLPLPPRPVASNSCGVCTGRSGVGLGRSVRLATPPRPVECLQRAKTQHQGRGDQLPCMHRDRDNEVMGTGGRHVASGSGSVSGMWHLHAVLVEGAVQLCVFARIDGVRIFGCAGLDVADSSTAGRVHAGTGGFARVFVRLARARPRIRHVSLAAAVCGILRKMEEKDITKQAVSVCSLWESSIRER